MQEELQSFHPRPQPQRPEFEALRSSNDYFRCHHNPATHKVKVFLSSPLLANVHKL